MAQISGGSIEERLFRIEARHAIDDLVARYAHAADRKNDRTMMELLFHPDATWSAEGFATLTGASAIGEGLERIAAEQVLWSIHYMIAPYVTFEPGGRSARCRWYLWELSTIADGAGAEDRWLGGWYDGIVTLGDNGWKFSSVILDLRVEGPARPPWAVKKGVDQ